MKNLLKALLVIIIALFISVNFIYVIKRNAAKKEAENYLSDKYTTKMIYKKTECSPVTLESNPYLKVYFYPDSNPNIEFFVYVNIFPVSIDEYTPTKLNLVRTPDNYLLKKFDYELSELLQNNLYAEDNFLEISAKSNNHFVHDVRIIETTDIYETEKLTDYNVYIETTISLKGHDLWELFQKIKELSLSPTEVVYSFNNENSIYFDEWKSIDEKEISKKLFIDK